MSEFLNKEKFFGRLIVGLAILYFFLGSNFDLNIYDEGLGLIGAERVGIGETPYVDFFTIYAPFNYYITAAYSLLFGGSVMSPRFLSLIFFVFALVGMHRIMKKSNNFNHMLIPGLVLLLTLGYSLFYARPTAAAIMFSVFALLFTINQIYEEEYIWSDDDDEDEEPETKPKPLTKYLIWSGVMVGFVMITRLYFGLALITAAFSAVLFTFDNPMKVKLKSIIKILAGTSIIVVPMFVYLLILVPIDLMYEQLIKIPLTIFGDYRSLPWPNPTEFLNIEDSKEQLSSAWFGLYALLPAVIFLYTSFSFHSAKKKGELTDRLKAALPISVFSFLLLSQSFVRSDIEHFIPSWLFSLLTIFILFDFKTEEMLKKGVVFLVVAGFATMPIYKKMKFIEEQAKPEYVYIEGIPRAERFKIHKDWYNDLKNAVRYVRSKTEREDRIFVCNDRNDKGYRNDAMFYFLVERLPATRYHELHPGVSTTERVHKEIVSDLNENRVDFIVRVYGLNDIDEPNMSSVSSNVHILDNFISENFKSEKRYGMYEILIRKEPIQ